MRICLQMKKYHLMLAVIVTATYACAPTTYAQDDSRVPVAADVQAGGFDLQGEYTGDLEFDGRKLRVGMQVIALGDNDYKLAVCHGGLPGDGWIAESGNDVSEKAESDGAVVTFRKDDRRVEFSAGTGQVFVGENHV